MFNRKKNEGSPKVMGDIVLINHLSETSFSLFDAVFSPKAKKVTGFRFHGVEIQVSNPTETVAFSYRLISFFADVSRLMDERHYIGDEKATPIIEAYLKANYGASYSFCEAFNPHEEAMVVVDSYVGTFDDDESFIASMLAKEVNSIRGIPTDASHSLLDGIDQGSFATWLMFQHYSEDNHYFKGKK